MDRSMDQRHTERHMDPRGMDPRRNVRENDGDIASFGVLLGVVAAAFIVLGVIIYFFGEDQSSQITAANNPPAQSERTMKTRSTPAEPSTVGQGGR
jgi:hypothetical protein